MYSRREASNTWLCKHKTKAKKYIGKISNIFFLQAQFAKKIINTINP